MKKILFSLMFMSAVAAYSQPKDEPVMSGQYEPNWENLAAWDCPDWFRDAKFGIWAHWDPQCQAEAGDWYAREMYYPGWKQDHHRKNFGDPKEYGYKELCRDWKADKWDPEELIRLYKSAGARYFMAMGNHHDNFDCWDSPYQEWNSMRMGPMKDIVGGWAKMCEKYGLKLGVSFHASHTWTWMESSTNFDGNLTREDGYAKNEDGSYKYWWHGLDPQELYAQNHPHSDGWEKSGSIHREWGWQNGAAQPSEHFKRKFQNRVLQCINAYNPAIIYFDDTVLPFWGCDESIGLNILTHYYNHSAAKDGTGKATVTLAKGTHHFADGYIAANEKDINITGDMNAVVGYWLGGMSYLEIGAQGPATGNNSDSKTVSGVPAATYTKAYVVGTLTGYQQINGTTVSNTWPGVSASATISVAGVACGSGSTSIGYISGVQMTDRDLPSQSISGTGTISSSGGSIVLREAVTVTQDEGNDVMRAYAGVIITAAYIY